MLPPSPNKNPGYATGTYTSIPVFAKLEQTSINKNVPIGDMARRRVFYRFEIVGFIESQNGVRVIAGQSHVEATNPGRHTLLEFGPEMLQERSTDALPAQIRTHVKVGDPHVAIGIVDE